MTRSSSVNLTRSPGDFSQLPTDASVETTDDQVVQECLAGNWEAFNQLVYKYRNLIGDVVARLLADRSEVDDIVQETFVEAMRLLRRYRPEGRFDRWLIGVAINKTRNHRRRGRWFRTVLRLDDLPDSDDRLVDAVSLSANGSTPRALARDALARLRQRAVLVALRQLPERQHTAVVLRYHAGYSFAEIAEALRISEGTVGPLLTRAGDQLREALAPWFDEEGDQP